MQSDVIVVGGGIVGASVAMAITDRYPRMRVLLLEKEPQLAQHQSGRNSGVIHSGIYYRPGSLKARTCVAGAAEMARFCREHGLPLDVCGKVIVATTPSQRPALDDLRRRGEENGLVGVQLLSGDELREKEPHVAGVAGLWVPSTGITDYGLVTRKYAELAAARGAQIELGARVRRIREATDSVTVESSRLEASARVVINCAGLQSDLLARAAGAKTDLRIVPFRGEYYRLKPDRSALVRNLIYPVPDLRFPFLGVHFTRRVDGQVDAGPNAVLSLKREGYRRRDIAWSQVRELFAYVGFYHLAAKYWRYAAAEMWRSLSKRSFVAQLRRLVPELQSSDLVPAGSGVRAQAVDGHGALIDDFAFYSTRRVLHVCNVPSPAATASLPLGRQIADRGMALLA